MKHLKFSIFLCALIISMPSYSQGLKAFKLKNGLSVYIWEDNTKSDVFGLVGVRAGSINDPEQYTGLAHYLEHLLFKGTDKIGALNWAEEEPIYKKIVQKYDEMAETNDPVRKEAINKEINELTIQAGKISVSNEFSNLIESIGGKGLNAGTSFDLTTFYNSFPAFQLNKWLEISSQRFINPIFRTFQTELETVYEEYNRGKDNSGNATNDFIMGKAFEGHPYSRSIIGLGEHLKNPRISKLIDFYNSWYTPDNMVLILAGNVNAKQISSRIAATFGLLEKKTMPERKTYPDLNISGRKQYIAKVGNNPSVHLVYKGAKGGDPDEIPLEITMELLQNSSLTGTLDKLSIDGEITYGSASLEAMREQGRCIITAVPLYDENQKLFESNKGTEKKIIKAIQKVANGEVDDWAINAIKANMCRDFDLKMESNSTRARILLNAFINEQNLGDVLGYKEKVMSVTIDDIKNIAKKYLSDNFLALYVEKGKPSKESKMEKPGYKAIEPPVGKSSLYASQFKYLPIGQVKENLMNFDDVQIKKVNERSKLYYTKNPENDVFSLQIRYGAGTAIFPKLGYAASLMNNAGVMGSYEAQELKKEFSKLNATCDVQADDSYLSITLRGYDNTLAQACQLLSRQILMPKLDDKQLSQLKGSALGGRSIQKQNNQILTSALGEFLKYQENSDYIKDLTDKQIYDLQIAELTGDINRASNYEAEIYYVGNMDFDQVYNILSKNLPLVANEKESNSPVIKDFAKYTENTVYFLPNTDAEQSQILFFMQGENYDKKDDVLRDAFNQYFSGGFNGLVLNEIREKRSMAYTAGAYIDNTGIKDKPTYFFGNIGTQNDKAIEALSVFLDLLNNMPKNPDRMDNIKSYLRQEALTTHPDFRYKARVYEKYKKLGYTEDPAKENLSKIDALTFDDIYSFYLKNIKGHSIGIAIMGNPKSIKAEDLKKFGKVIKLNENKLFNDKDGLF